jgi:NADPH:quinone reductase-like Zn-dependent oxidoreductase
MIDALGAGVHGGLAAGDRVWGSTSIGAWTQQRCLQAQALQPVAPQASLDEAAVLAQDCRTLGRVLLLP